MPIHAEIHRPTRSSLTETERVLIEIPVFTCDLSFTE